MKESDLNTRHQERMARKKAVVDAGIEKARQKKGLIIVNTGNGKGKTSSALGMLARSLGHGMRCAVIQFIKGRGATGEELFFAGLPNVDFHVMGDGFTWETQNREQDIATAQRAWHQALAYLQNPEYDFVLLDELTIVLKYGYLEEEPVLQALANKPTMQHVVITGRGAPPNLIGLADTVSEIRDVKHAYRHGIQAQKGVEL